MRALAGTVVVAIVLALSLVLALVLLSSGLIGVAIIFVPVTAISVAATIVALIFKQDSGRAGGIAARISLALALLLGAIGAFLVKGAGPSCDAFCFTRTEAAIIVFVAAICFGALVAVCSALLAAIIVGAARRLTTSR